MGSPAEVKPRSEGDILGNAFSQLIARQHALIGEVKNATRSVAEASRQLTKASEQTAQITQQITNAMQQLAKGASEQSNSLQGTMKSEEELLRAIDQIARGSQEQAAGVEQASGMVKQVSTAIVQVSGNARAGAEAWRSTAKSAENGARMTHETVEGMKKVKVPPGTQSHTKMRLKGLGIPHFQKEGKGDEYVKVIVRIPRRVTEKSRELIQELAKEGL
jgi:methyl-accepting chemotaxis protein